MKKVFYFSPDELLINTYLDVFKQNNYTLTLHEKFCISNRFMYWLSFDNPPQRILSKPIFDDELKGRMMFDFWKNKLILGENILKLTI